MLRLLIVSIVLLLGVPVSAATSASIKVQVWQDDDGDGQIESHEIGLAKQVRLTETTSGAQSAVSTDETGGYVFEDLPPGTYVVEIELGLAGSTVPSRQIGGVVKVKVDLTSTMEGAVNFGIFPVSKIPIFLGLVQFEGQLLTEAPVVNAIIDGKNCGVPHGVKPPNFPASSYSVAVAPEELFPGCGAEGRPLSFSVNGNSANESVTWASQEAVSPTRLDLTVGEAPAGPGIRPPDTGDAGLR